MVILLCSTNSDIKTFEGYLYFYNKPFFFLVNQVKISENTDMKIILSIRFQCQATRPRNMKTYQGNWEYWAWHLQRSEVIQLAPFNSKCQDWTLTVRYFKNDGRWGEGNSPSWVSGGQMCVCFNSDEGWGEGNSPSWVCRVGCGSLGSATRLLLHLSYPRLCVSSINTILFLDTLSIEML